MKILSLIFIALTMIFSSLTFGWGTENYGNKPLDKLNYSAWNGTNILPILNDTNRIYSTWCNGNEYFYFKGDITSLNNFLKKCENIKKAKIIIEIKDGDGIIKTFNKSKILYNWNVNIKTGIAAAHFGENENKIIALTIYADGQNIQRQKILIPKTIKSHTTQDEATKKRSKDYIAGKKLPKSDLVEITKTSHSAVCLFLF